jgi:hypothetical protein
MLALQGYMLASAETEDDSMTRRKKHSPGENVAKLQQVEVSAGQRAPAADAVRSLGATEASYTRRPQEFGGLKLDRHLCTENQRWE